MKASKEDDIMNEQATRRQLRRDQSTLHDKILEKRELLTEVGGTNQIEELREENNQLFKKYVHEYVVELVKCGCHTC